MKKRVLAQFLLAGLRPPSTNHLMPTELTDDDLKRQNETDLKRQITGGTNELESDTDLKRQTTGGSSDIVRLSSINFLKNCMKPMRDKAEEPQKPSGSTDVEAAELARRFNDGSESASLSNLALKMRIPLNIIMHAWDLFESLAQLPQTVKLGLDKSVGEGPRPSGMSVLTGAGLSHKEAVSVMMHTGTITTQSFADMLQNLSQAQNSCTLPEELLYNCFSMADSNGNGSLDFEEFALWYSTCSFREELVCSDEQIELRAIAKRQEIDLNEIGKYKKAFEGFDLDKDGLIDRDEFVHLLGSVLKLPSHLDIPASRVKQFWFEADNDSNGSISFEEFLIFYRQYFSTADRGQNTCPIEDFYR